MENKNVVSLSAWKSDWKNNPKAIDALMKDLDTEQKKEEHMWESEIDELTEELEEMRSKMDEMAVVMSTNVVITFVIVLAFIFIAWR